jgi:hypothetical protein
MTKKRDHRKAATDDRLRQLVDDSLLDPLPSVAARQVIKRLRARHRCQLSGAQAAEVELAQREVREGKIATAAEMAQVWQCFGSRT